MTAALDAALEYRERGFSPIPLIPGGKTPHFGVLKSVHGSAKWSRLRKEPASEAQIREWAKRDGEFNVGIITGRSSGGLVVADFDTTDHGIEFPASPRARTRRGHHVYMRAESSELATRRLPAGLGELLGEGNLVVAPPSRHESGALYEWEVDLDAAPLAPLADLAITQQDPHTSGGTQGSTTSVTCRVAGTCRAVGGDAVDEAEADHLAGDGAAVERVMGLWGIGGVGLEKKFCCILPGHSEQDPSASIFEGRDTGVYVYRDFHFAERGASATLSLAAVHASIVSGKIQRLTRATRPRWYLRLFHEAGCIETADVPMAPVPPDCPPSVHAVAEGFRLLVGLRWRRDPGEGVPFSWSFAAPWCRLSERHAGGAIRELLRLSLIEPAGTYECRVNGLLREGRLYLPGPGPTPRLHGARRS